MRLIKFVSLLIFISFSNISCSNDDESNISTDLAYVIEVNAPETAKVGEAIGIEVTFTMKNTCGRFSKFVESSEEQGKIIEVQASYKGSACGQAFIEDTQVYEFTPQQPGPYQFNFRSLENEFITITIEATE